MVRPGAAIINGNPYPLQTTPSLLFLDSSHIQKSTLSTICVRSLCNSIAGYYRELHIHPAPPCLFPTLVPIQDLGVHKLLGPPSRTRTWNTGIFCVFYGSYFVLTTSLSFFTQYRIVAFIAGIGFARLFNFAASTLFVYSEKRL